MGILDALRNDAQKVENKLEGQPQAQTQPEAATPANPDQPPVDAAPVQQPEETAAETPDSETPEEPQNEGKEDRSHFNCGNCGGEGLLGDPYGQNRPCDVCHGTGHVEI